MLHRVRSLVTVLALGIPTVAVAQPRKKPDPVSTFLQQDRYTYCDVKILSSLWKQSINDAKATVGLKLQSRNTAYLEAQLRTARVAARKNAAARCSFHEAGFGYDDAVKLAKIWKKTPAGAKAYAEQKILAGGEQYVRELVGDTGSEDPTATYLKQDRYTYCDVKLLSAMWKTSIADAKATIGLKLQSRNEAYLNAELTKARRRPAVRCSYVDAGLSYADVERIAKLWKVSVSRAKVTIGKKVTANGSDFVRELLGGPGTESEADLQAFLRQRKYTYCDAAAIGAMWKSSVEDGKTFIGMKLRIKSTAALDKVVADARVYARTNAVAGCPKPTKRPLPPPPRR